METHQAGKAIAPSCCENMFQDTWWARNECSMQSRQGTSKEIVYSWRGSGWWALFFGHLNFYKNPYSCLFFSLLLCVCMYVCMCMCMPSLSSYTQLFTKSYAGFRQYLLDGYTQELANALGACVDAAPCANTPPSTGTPPTNGVASTRVASSKQDGPLTKGLTSTPLTSTQPKQDGQSPKRPVYMHEVLFPLYVDYMMRVYGDDIKRYRYVCVCVCVCVCVFVCVCVCVFVFVCICFSVCVSSLTSLPQPLKHPPHQSPPTNPTCTTHTHRAYITSADMRQPHSWYKAARKMKRTVIYHAGPTNSGKTHAALEALSKAQSGVYCGPLRLLAVEVFEKMNNRGVPCNLLTGVLFWGGALVCCFGEGHWFVVGGVKHCIV